MGVHERKARRLVALVLAVPLTVGEGIACARSDRSIETRRNPIVASSDWPNATELNSMGLYRHEFDDNVVFACHREVGEKKHHITTTLRKVEDGLLMRVTDAKDMETWRNATGLRAKAIVRDLEENEKIIGEFQLVRIHTIEAGKPGTALEAHVGKLFKPGRSYNVGLVIEDGQEASGGVRFANVVIEDVAPYL